MIKYLAALSILLLGTLYSCSDREKHLSKESFGEDWPFKVSDGTVECLDEYMIVFRGLMGNEADAVTGSMVNLSPPVILIWQKQLI